MNKLPKILTVEELLMERLADAHIYKMVIKSYTDEGEEYSYDSELDSPSKFENFRSKHVVHFALSDDCTLFILILD